MCKICLTCQHYRPFLHCAAYDRHIHYGVTKEQFGCERYEMSDDYKPGGKFYGGEACQS